MDLLFCFNVSSYEKGWQEAMNLHWAPVDSAHEDLQCVVKAKLGCFPCIHDQSVCSTSLAYRWLTVLVKWAKTEIKGLFFSLKMLGSEQGALMLLQETIPSSSQAKVLLVWKENLTSILLQCSRRWYEVWLDGGSQDCPGMRFWVGSYSKFSTAFFDLSKLKAAWLLLPLGTPSLSSHREKFSLMAPREVPASPFIPSAFEHCAPLACLQLYIDSKSTETSKSKERKRMMKSLPKS